MKQTLALFPALVAHTIKDGGNWDHQVRTAHPHNPGGGLGVHVATINGALNPFRGNGAAEDWQRLFAASPDLLADIMALADAADIFAEHGKERHLDAMKAAIAKARETIAKVKA